MYVGFAHGIKMHRNKELNFFLAVISALINYYLLSFEVDTIFGSKTFFRKTCFLAS